MKRKDYDDICEEFSSVHFSLPSTKARRLDAEIFPISNEDSRTTAPQTVEHGLPQEPHSTGSSSMLHKNPFPEEICPSDEKALVLYNPTDTPLLRLPPPPDFSIILNSDLVPGLKDIFLLGQSKTLKQDKYEVGKEQTNSCLTIVPWGQYNLPVTSRGEAEEMSDPMDAEEVDMMDTDECNFGCSGGTATAFGLDGMDIGAARMLLYRQQQQQQQQEQSKITPNPISCEKSITQNGMTDMLWSPFSLASFCGLAFYMQLPHSMGHGLIINTICHT